MEIDDKDILFYIDYLKYERRLSENTVDSYYENLKLVSNTLKCELINLSSDDIRDFLYNVDVTSRTKAHYLTVLNSFYNYLIFCDKIKKNPCDSISNLKLSKKLPVYLTIEEVDKLFDIKLYKPNDYRNKAMLEVLFATGIRISELVNLELSQINFDECIIRVHGKGKKDRIVPMGNNAMKFLQIYINNYRKYFLKTLFDGEKEVVNNYVFLNKNGGRISRQGFFKIIKKLCVDANIKKNVSPHTLRHSFATYMLNRGVDLRVIQELLGHENLETTEVYSHLSNKKIEDDYKNHPHAHMQ